MLLLHFSGTLEAVLLLVIVGEIAQQLKNSVPNWKTSLVNILLPNVFSVQSGAFELELATICERGAVLAVKFVRNNPNKNFVLHKDTISIFLEGDIKLKCSVVSAPCVVTLVTPKLKEPFLQTLHNEEIFVVPVVTVLVEETSKCFLGCPLNTNPLEHLVLSVLAHHCLVLDWQFTVYVVFDLFNGRVTPCSIICPFLEWCLKPVGYFENIPCLKLLISQVHFVVWRTRCRLLINTL